MSESPVHRQIFGNLTNKRFLWYKVLVIYNLQFIIFNFLLILWQYQRSTRPGQAAIKDDRTITYTPAIYRFAKIAISQPCRMKFVKTADITRAGK